MSGQKVAIAERGDPVPSDADDEARPMCLGPKLASGLSIQATFRYRTDSSKLPERCVVIDSLYGGDLDAPEYLRGLDQLSGELRVFRLDRIEWIAALGHVERSYPGWLLGKLVRFSAGLEMTRRPVNVAIDAPVLVIQVAAQGGQQRRIEGRAVHFIFSPNGEYTAAWMDVKGRAESGPTRNFRAHLVTPYDRPWKHVCALNLETLEEITDIISWAECHPTAQQNQR